MARHFISVLGTGEYSSIRYGTDEIETVFVQEAVIRQKLGKLSPEDKVTIFITDKAESDNYNNRAYNEREIEKAEKNNIKLPAVRIGLRETLIKSGIAEEQLSAVKIPVGNGDAELMEIFSAIYNSLDEKDEVYADITHSLRNIPMQLLAVLTFAETVKKIDVKGIYYGAFEVKQDGVAPIFDLLGYLNIIKWSFAAKSFIEFGDSDAITALSKMEYGMAARNRAEETVRLQKMKDIAKYLNSLTHDLETARGCRPKSKATKENNIITAYEQYQKGLCEYRDFEEQNADDKIISPLNTLVDVIDEKVNIFSVDNNLDAGISAIDWAIEYKKTQ